MDRDGVNRGEWKRLTSKELGGRAIGVTNKNGRTAERMALHMAELGYRGDWVEVGRDPYNNQETFDVDGNAFLTALEDDISGIRLSRPSTNCTRTRLVKELIDKVLSGQASEQEIQQFEQLATEFGVPDKGIKNIVFQWYQARESAADGRSEAASLPDNARDGEGRAEDVGEPRLTDDQLDEDYTLSDDGTLIDPNGQPLFKREQQLSFTQEGLLQQEAAQDPDRGRLTTPKTEETGGTLGQLAQSKDERVSHIATLLAKFQRYGVSDLALADLTAALEAYSYLRSNKFTVEEYLRQGSLFGPSSLSSVQEGMLKAYDALKTASLARAIKTYVRELAKGKAEFNGKPEDEEAALFRRGDLSRLPDDALLSCISIQQQGHLIALNPAAYELLSRIYGKAFGSGVPVNFTGVFNDPPSVSRVIAGARRLATQYPQHKKTLATLERTLRAAAAPDGTVIAYRRWPFGFNAITR
ncbi:MAG: hypothetical protein ACR2HX_25165 [Pyrinomonadaceae bacterium]